MEKILTAHNDAADSGNPMHDDEAARAMGFKGAVVPGVTVYGYVTQALLDYFGDAWLSRGYCRVRFRQPVIANEQIRIESRPGDNGQMLDVTVENSAGTVTAIASGSMDARAAPAFSQDGVVTQKIRPAFRVNHDGKWPPVAETFLREKVLRSFVAEIGRGEHNSFCTAMGDQRAIYQTAIHPAWLLRQANIIVDRNIDLGAWIHTESEVANLGLAPVNEPIQIRAQLLELFDRKNNEYVDLDVLMLVAGDEHRPVLRAMHRAIYKPALTK